MYIVSVIPITKQPIFEELTYFSRHEFPLGSVITVNLRKRPIEALVTKVDEVQDAKTMARTADFALRKITTKHYRYFVRPEAAQALKKIAEYYASSYGATLFSAIPAAIRSDTQGTHEKFPKQKKETRFENRMLQATFPERIEEYRNLIRSSFAKGQSVFVVVPTIYEVGRVAALLERGIERYLHTLHSGVSKKQIQERWHAARSERHPVVVVMTGGFLTLPRLDLGLIIVEREQTSSYKAQTKPYIDTRHLAKELARAYQITLVRADLPLSVELLYEHQTQECGALKDLPTRLIKGPRYHTIDMRTPASSDPTKRAVLSLVSRELYDALGTALSNGEQAFLFVARRGLAPITVCSDCGSRVSCHACGAPVILHKAGREHIFICHSCGAMRPSNESCATCTSWRLTTLGIGRQLVERELARMFPEVPIFPFDRDVITTRKQAREHITAFYETPGSILLGTEMGLLHLDRPVPVSGIISLDSLLSIPEWSIYERIMALLMKIRENTTREMYVQTRKPDEPILTLAERGEIGKFYRNEISERKQYGYPPFTTLLKITATGRADEVKPILSHIAEELGRYGFSTIPQLMQTPKGQYMMHGFLRLPKNQWPHPHLLTFFKTLPPSVRVEVDPQKIL